VRFVAGLLVGLVVAGVAVGGAWYLTGHDDEANDRAQARVYAEALADLSNGELERLTRQAGSVWLAEIWTPQRRECLLIDIDRYILGAEGAPGVLPVDC
jgi:type II secretory pathway component PulK